MGWAGTALSGMASDRGAGWPRVGGGPGGGLAGHYPVPNPLEGVGVDVLPAQGRKINF